MLDKVKKTVFNCHLCFDRSEATTNCCMPAVSSLSLQYKVDAYGLFTIKLPIIIKIWK